MFAYIDKKIHRLLQDENKIRTVGRAGERRISLIGPVPLPVQHPETGEEHILRWYPFVRRTELDEVNRISADLREGRSDDLFTLINSFMAVSSVLLHGDFEHQERPLVRLHSCCMTGDVFGSMRCDCGPQLHRAYAQIFDAGAGAVVYLASHEGRGIGLWAKAVTYILQDMGQDTYQANESLGLPADSRDFSDAALAIKAFLADQAQVRLLTNNPMKEEQLLAAGVPVAERVPLVVGVSEHSLRYLRAKKTHGHDFGEDGLPPEPAGSGEGTEDPSDQGS